MTGSVVSGFSRMPVVVSGFSRTSPHLLVLLLVLGFATAPTAQTLTLDEALAMAVQANPDAKAAAAATDAARAEADAARASWWPRVTAQESWQRGNQPVFAFGSLLAQRRFTAADFAVASLNHPDPIDNFRAAVGLHQPIFDPAGTEARADAAATALALAGSSFRLAAANIETQVAATYGRILSATADLRAADAAIAAATSLQATAQARFDGGTVTRADVMSAALHLSQMQARRVQAAGAVAIARATLNRLLGRPLETPFEVVEIPRDGSTNPALDTAGTRPVLPPAGGVAALPPETAAARDRVAVADAALREARAAWLPAVSADAGWEWNGHAWATRAGSWVAGVQAAWSFSPGGGESARIRAALAARERARAEQAAADADLQLAPRIAATRLDVAFARQNLAVSAAGEARARERLVRDRYAGGLATITDVLAAAQGVLDAESLAASVQAELVEARVAIRRAQGQL